MAGRKEKILKFIKDFRSLPKVEIRLDKTPTGQGLYKTFNKPHPKAYIIRNKTFSVALVQTHVFKSGEEYLQSVNGKNSAAYFSRKAAKSGYVFRPIDPNQYIDAIFSINTSSTSRQGKTMDASYTNKIMSYPYDEHNLFYGVFKGDTLVSYLWVVRSGELAILNRLLGHDAHLKEGIMYLMVTSYISHAIDEIKQVKFVMYDTFFGASDGLKMFKSRCGFNAYKVKWLQE